IGMPARAGVEATTAAGICNFDTGWLAAIFAARKFQSGRPSALATSSRLSLWVRDTDLAFRASRRVCAMALASWKSRIGSSSALANEKCQALALLTRSLGQRLPEAARYVHRTQKGRKQRVVSTRWKICAPAGEAVNYKPGVISCDLPVLRAVEIKPARCCAKYFRTRGRVRNGIDQPVDRGPIRELALMADEGAVARPHQPVGTGDAEQLARILLCLGPEPVAAGHLDPGAARVDGAQQRLETLTVDSGFRIGAAKVIDHDPDAGGQQRRQDFRQILTVDMRMHVPVEIREATKQRAILECGDVRKF